MCNVICLVFVSTCQQLLLRCVCCSTFSNVYELQYVVYVLLYWLVMFSKCSSRLLMRSMCSMCNMFSKYSNCQSLIVIMVCSVLLVMCINCSMFSWLQYMCKCVCVDYEQQYVLLVIVATGVLCINVVLSCMYQSCLVCVAIGCHVSNVQLLQTVYQCLVGVGLFIMLSQCQYMC